ncbi:DUF547 domain-containing protein [Snuella sedimenti]|uniref:DUF547 domain-containing protein n=1 Tax=Snuella sedimenti TaxID=2798802 RepID=A0A8J7IR76_9FLAO|nr:DUF547 domain-containing protein [Snuella sedimenti]MBJ6369657.1 DUF547 domain-containing protein [Snuella sedimenti]
MIRLYNVLLLFFLSVSVFGQKADHGLWNAFLQTYVSKEGLVNYKSIQSNPEHLNTYLNTITKTPPQSHWTKQETLAYWVNAYNAFTIKLIIDNYPLNSIKDIKNPWDKKFITIKNKTLSLNQIEHDILRNMNEPRIHFAIVCASMSCPKLYNEAYNAKNLEAQLNKAAKHFLNDTTKNKITKNKLELSKLFKWFSSDFKQNGKLVDFLKQYSDIDISKKAKITYKDYNWNLNE